MSWSGVTSEERGDTSPFRLMSRERFDTQPLITTYYGTSRLSLKGAVTCDHPSGGCMYIWSAKTAASGSVVTGPASKASTTASIGVLDTSTYL